jgi:hypothetical protein
MLGVTRSANLLACSPGPASTTSAVDQAFTPTTDGSITRILYAILNQKDPKNVSTRPLQLPLLPPTDSADFPQTDWDKVAHDPIVSQEISNSHAARMRYSRFKKEVETASSVRVPRRKEMQTTKYSRDILGTTQIASQALVEPDTELHQAQQEVKRLNELISQIQSGENIIERM